MTSSLDSLDAQREKLVYNDAFLFVFAIIFAINFSCHAHSVTVVVSWSYSVLLTHSTWICTHTTHPCVLVCAHTLASLRKWTCIHRVAYSCTSKLSRHICTHTHTHKHTYNFGTHTHARLYCKFLYPIETGLLCSHM